MEEEKSLLYSSMPKIGQETVLMAPQDFVYLYSRKHDKDEAAPKPATPKAKLTLTKHSNSPPPDRVPVSPVSHSLQSKQSQRSQRTNPIFAKSSGKLPKSGSKGKSRGMYHKILEECNKNKAANKKMLQENKKKAPSKAKLTAMDNNNNNNNNKDDEDAADKAKPSCCWCRYGAWFCMCICGHPPDTDPECALKSNK